MEGRAFLEEVDEGIVDVVVISDPLGGFFRNLKEFREVRGKLRKVIGGFGNFPCLISVG